PEDQSVLDGSDPFVTVLSRNHGRGAGAGGRCCTHLLELLTGTVLGYRKRLSIASSFPYIVTRQISRTCYRRLNTYQRKFADLKLYSSLMALRMPQQPRSRTVSPKSGMRGS